MPQAGVRGQNSRKSFKKVFLSKTVLWLRLSYIRASIRWKQIDTIRNLNRSNYDNLFENDTNVVQSIHISFSYRRFVSYRINTFKFLFNEQDVFKIKDTMKVVAYICFHTTRAFGYFLRIVPVLFAPKPSRRPGQIAPCFSPGQLVSLFGSHCPILYKRWFNSLTSFFYELKFTFWCICYRECCTQKCQLYCILQTDGFDAKNRCHHAKCGYLHTKP